MTGCKATYHPGRLPNWLCAVSLVFSLFTLAGHTAPVQSHIQQTVVASEYQFVKRAIAYKKSNTTTSPLNALLAYNRLEQVRYAHRKAEQLEIEIKISFRQLKVIPPTPFEALPA